MTLGFTTAMILLGGWLFSRLFDNMKLPGILGMLLFGILGGFFYSPLIPPVLWDLEPTLKSLALIVILLRAGLGLSRATLNKVGLTAVLMTFIPCLFEGVALTLLIHHFFSFPWPVSGLSAFMLAAVSPAVVVPSMLELKEGGYGKEKEVPSIVLAGASVDDVIAITLYSLFLTMAVTGDVNPGRTLLSLPLSLITGIIPGAVIGLMLVRYFRANHENIRATEKALILLCGSLLLVELGDLLHSAALLGIMTMGFVLLEGAEEAAHELADKFKKIWVFAEIVLFVLIGLSVDVPTALKTGLTGLVVVSAGLVFRSLGVWLATAFSDLNRRERTFCMIAYLPKATVQAALGSVALQKGLPEGETVLALAVLAILFTAPLGLLGIKFWGRKLLA